MPVSLGLFFFFFSSFSRGKDMTPAAAAAAAPTCGSLVFRPSNSGLASLSQDFFVAHFEECYL